MTRPGRTIAISPATTLEALVDDRLDGLLWTYMEDAHGRFVAPGMLPRDRFFAHLGEARAAGPGALWVVRHEGHPEGFLEIALAGGRPRLSELYVAPAHRGNGLGAMILVRAEGLLAEAGPLAELHVFVANVDAIRFYERHGWSAAGRTTLFSPDDQQVMQKLVARAVAR